MIINDYQTQLALALQVLHMNPNELDICVGNGYVIGLHDGILAGVHKSVETATLENLKTIIFTIEYDSEWTVNLEVTRN